MKMDVVSSMNGQHASMNGQHAASTPRTGNTFSSDVVVVTPAMAREWLKTNRNNRAPSQHEIDAIADAILRDEYEMTSDGVGFDVYGSVTNGQHRLMAIIQADRAVPMVVVTGLSAKSRLVQDSHRPRKAAETVNMYFGDSEAEKKYSILRQLFELQKQYSPRRPNALVLHRAISEGKVRDALTWGAKQIPVCPKQPLTLVAAFACAYLSNPVAVDEAWCRYITDASLPGSPFRLLWALEKPTGSRKERRALFTKTIAALAAEVSGRKLELLRKSDLEPRSNASNLLVPWQSAIEALV